MLKHLINFSGDWDLLESHLVLLTVGTRDWGNSFSMPLVLSKMPKVCPVAAQVITFKNDGAVCPLLGVFILLQDIQIIYELSTYMLPLVPKLLVLNLCWPWWWLAFVVPNICWFWWWLIFAVPNVCWFWDSSILASIKIYWQSLIMLINCLVGKLFMHFWVYCLIWMIFMCVVLTEVKYMYAHCKTEN